MELLDWPPVEALFVISYKNSDLFYRGYIHSPSRVPMSGKNDPAEQHMLWFPTRASPRPAVARFRGASWRCVDLIVGELVIAACKATSTYSPVFEGQALSLLRQTGLKPGLVVNFGECDVRDGIHRVGMGSRRRETQSRGDVFIRTFVDIHWFRGMLQTLGDISPRGAVKKGTNSHESIGNTSYP